MKENNDKLELWQERLATNEAAYQHELELMDGREALYKGDRKLRDIVVGEKKSEAVHVRNIVAELVFAHLAEGHTAPFESRVILACKDVRA